MKRCNKVSCLGFVIILTGFSASLSFAEEYDPRKAAADRVQRQLSLANKMKVERLKREGKKAKQAEKQEKLNMYCVKSTDSLRQYEKARFRWYALNAKGEREYLTEKQVESKKAHLRKQIEQNC